MLEKVKFAHHSLQAIYETQVLFRPQRLKVFWGLGESAE